MTGVTLSAQNVLMLRKIASELLQACQQLSSREWMCLLLRALRKAGYATAKTKIEAISRFVVSATGTAKRYAKNGFSKSVSEDCQRILSGIHDLPEKARQQIGAFMALPREKRIEQVISLSMTCLIFYFSAGGSDLEGGLPDLDIKAGIGGHRNIFSHSILLGLGTEFTLRLITELILLSYDRLSTPHHSIWDKMHSFIVRNSHLAIAALWAGIGAHLLKDAALLSPRTKAVVGLPGSHPMKFHQAFLASNATLSGLFAGAGASPKK
ncbi:MAG: hypothetical protein ACOX8I_00115 [Bacillota bacterium]|jgi:hypothetical protein